jgi:biotin carboxyl carrier protein
MLNCNDKVLDPMLMAVRKAIVAINILFAMVALLQSCKYNSRSGPSRDMNASANFVKAEHLKEVASALGYIEPISEVVELATPAYSPFSVPRVEKVLVREGQIITRGQALVIFDSLAKTKADMRRSWIEMKGLERKEKILVTKTRRFEILAIQGAFPSSELEDIQIRRLETTTKLLAAREDHNKMVALAKDSVLRSPLTGVVFKIFSKPGERASENQAVMEIGDTRNIQILSEVDESLIHRIYRGQNARITSVNKAFQGAFDGTVEEIQPMVRRRTRLPMDSYSDPDRDPRIVQVKIILLKPASEALEKFSGAKVKVSFGK